MPYRTYQSVARAARELAAGGDVVGALNVLSREAAAFPLYTGIAALARARLLARLGNTSQALECLSGALDAGYRIRREWLQDPELAPLASDPRFAELTARAERDYALAMKDARPRLQILQPRGSAPHEGFPLLVVLHGNNSNVELTASYWRSAADKGWLVAFAGSSEVGSAPGTYLWADRDRAASELATHMETVRARSQIDERRVVLAGFSGGATLALALTLTARFRAKGVIAIAAYLPVIGEFTRRIEDGGGNGLRAYLVVGEEDESGYTGTAGLAQVFAENAVAARLEVHPELGHEYPVDMSSTLESALAFVLPSGPAPPRRAQPARRRAERPARGRSRATRT